MKYFQGIRKLGKIIENSKTIGEIKTNIDKSRENKQGITLIALVVTIVVLLILAGITINLLFSNGGIFDIANQAKIEHEIGALKDRINNVIADWSIERAIDSSITVDVLWEKMVDADIIDNPKEDVSGPKKEGENDRYELTTNEGYIVEIIISPDGNVSIGDVEKGDKLPPKIGEITSTSESNSIHIEVEITRSEGEVSLNYYYKKEGEADSSYTALKEGTKELTADFTGLEQGVVYNIKVVIEDGNGTAEKTINVTTGKLTGSVTQKGETIWNNGIASIELETTKTGVTIQYQVGGTEGEWQDYKGPITGLKHGDTVFAVITDGTNQSGYSSIDILDKINPQKATISLSTTTTKENETITATVTHTDNESGVDIIKCKWVYNTNSSSLGTNESSYPNTFNTNNQTINLTATAAGTYYLHVLTQDKAGNKIETISNGVMVEEKVVADGSFSKSKGVNTPNLANGKLTPVKWVNGNPVETTPDDPEWYDYSTTAKKWANAQTADGSLWVWIPRYAYQINSLYNTLSTTGGEINIKFMKDTTNEAADGTIAWDNTSGQGNWSIHPAFNYGQTVSGIWVAKYEASSNSTIVVENPSEDQLANYGRDSWTNTSFKVRVKPNVTSWRAISVGEIFTVCKNITTTGNSLEGTTNIDSHMMKNTEWGAVAYLAQSSYGKNAEVWINPNSNFLTGQAGTGASVGSTTSTSAYNSGNGPQASTTGNVYGVYDMSGGAYEYTAAYVNNGNSNLTSNGASLVSGAAYTKDVYTKGSADDRPTNYAAAASKYGDAVYETSLSSNGTPNWNTSWYSDYSNFPYSTNPFFIRGGYYNYTSNAGLFCFNSHDGYANSNNGFRPVLVAL